jgi:alpha-tubulin suppressor-like RCC1 family protein
MPIGISSGTIRNKRGKITFDKIKKIVQTYGNLYFLTENGILSAVGLNNSVQLRGSNIKEANARYDATYTQSTYTWPNGFVSKIDVLDKTFNIKANYIGEWGLQFDDTTGSTNTPNLNYIYSDLVNSRNDVLDFDAGCTYTNDNSYQSSLFKNFIFYINKNGELWGWGYNANLELGISSDTGYNLKLPKYGTTPDIWEWGNTTYPIVRPILNTVHESLENKTVFSSKKLNNSSNWKSVVANNIGDNYKHILLNSNGEIYTFGGDLNAPQKLGINSDWKYISYDYAINNNNELYSIRTTETTTVTSALKFSGYVKSTKSTPSVYETLVDVLSSDLKEVILDSGIYDTPEDNLNLYLFKNGKLYASGSNYYSGLNDLKNNVTGTASSILKSKDLISIDEIIGETIKSAYQCCGAYFAITNSNKLYTWGSNYNGRAADFNTYGRGRTQLSRGDINTATHINYLSTGITSGVDVAKVVPNNMATYVIGTDGSLRARGYNFSLGTLGNNVTTAGAQDIVTIISSGVKDVKSLVTTSYAVGTNGLLSGWGYHSNQTAGWINEDVSSIRYSFITGVVSGIDGNLYVCDNGNNSIKQINAKKQVKLFSTINFPKGITQDSFGNLYVTSGHAVLKITPDKTVTTFAGLSATSGNINAQGTNARFNTPRGITIDSSNNLYVCDSVNNSIKKITIDGTVTLIAGSKNGLAGIDDYSPNNSTITAIAAGTNHSLFLRSNGTLLGVGANVSGQLGDGTTTNKTTPVQVSNWTNVTAIDAGNSHSLFLRNNGTVWSVGGNTNGQLGDGTTTNKSTPVQVSNWTNVTAIAAGNSHSLFLKNDGTVWSVGNNLYGQLGDGTTTHRSTPVQVSNWTNVIAIAAGSAHSLFLKNDGTVWSCGINAHGQLGVGTTTDRLTPVQVSNWTNVTAIAAGNNHSLFLRSDGTVWSVGNNSNGQLGDGTTTNRSTPVQVSNWTNVTAIAAGAAHSLFLKNDGTVWSVGLNTNGQLGVGTTTDRLTPVQVSNWTNVTAIAAGNNHSLFLRSDGTVWSVGDNANRQLGDGTTTNRSTPVQIEEPSARFSSPRAITIDTGNNDLFVADTNNHTVRRITSAGVVTTVAGVAGTAGNTTGPSIGVGAARLNEPIAVGYTSNGVYVKAGLYIRRITTTQVLAVVGNTSNFANGTGTNGLIKGDVTETGSIIVNGTNSLLYTDSGNFCLRSINTDNNSIDLYSGGGALNGNVITNGMVNNPKPVELANVNNIDRIVVAGSNQSILGYAITNNKNVYAWGKLTSTKNILEPELLSLPPVKDIVISINTTYKTPYGITFPNNASTFFVGDDGGLSAIGETYLGNGTNTKSDTIIKINIPTVKKLIVAGVGKIYALGTDGGLSAWGNNSDGFLGVSNTDTTDRLSPVKINLPPIEDIYTTNNGISDGTTVPAWTTVIVLGINKSLSGWGQGNNLGFANAATNSKIPVALTSFEPEVTGVYPSYFNTIVSYNALKTSKKSYYSSDLSKIGTDTDWKIVDKHGDYAIKTDNTLWSISSTPYQIGTDTDYENVFYGTPVRTTDPFDIKIQTTQYFTSTDTDTLNALNVIKPERTVINMREYDYNTKFVGVSANTLHGSVTTYKALNFNSTNYKINQPQLVKY